ncbi:MAG: glutamate 5-kinase [Deltaproteobacteria bacterium]|nr:glutamate 5-kinase [Deltaproteobacteria bacterium]
MNSRHFIQKTKLWVIKIGSSILTDSQGTPDVKIFSRLAQEMAQLRASGKQVILVSSGAIACGMHKIGLQTKPTQIAKKQAIAAAGQISLMNFYERAFSKHALNIAQILLTREDLSSPERHLNTRHAIHELLKMNCIPIINENDTVAVEEIKVGDNDNLSAWVSEVAQASLLVILTDQEGLYTADPRRNPQAEKLSLVEKISAKIKKLAQDTQGRGTTGGMITKLQAAERALSFGISTVIASGRRAGVLVSLAQGNEEGTLFLAQNSRGREK